MKVTMHAYYLYERRLRIKGMKDVESLETDLVEVVSYLKSKDLIDRRYEIKNTKKIIYLNAFEYYPDKRILFLEFKSAEYAHQRNVINTDTMEKDPKKKKGKKDGDEETTCMALKFDEDGNRGSCLTQINSSGVTLSKIIEYLNEQINEYHSNIKKDVIRYGLYSNNIVSEDFLAALEKTKRIKMVKLVVNSEDMDVSEFKDFSELNDVNDNMDIILKPAKKGMGIGTDTVKALYNLYRNPEKKIKRIWINSDELEGNPLSFDTEKMKQKEVVEVSDTITNEPKVEELKECLCRLVLLY